MSYGIDTLRCMWLWIALMSALILANHAYGMDRVWEQTCDTPIALDERLVMQGYEPAPLLPLWQDGAATDFMQNWRRETPGLIVTVVVRGNARQACIVARGQRLLMVREK